MGLNTGSITASYAIGDVSLTLREGGGENLAGGLTGENHAPSAITASYATGYVSLLDGQTGGLTGANADENGSMPGSITDSYWNTSTSGQSSGIGRGDVLGVSGKTTAELQTPTGYTGIYATWNVDLDNADGDDDPTTGGDDPWDFGTSSQYPVLKAIGRTAPTSASTPTATQTPTPTPTPSAAADWLMIGTAERTPSGSVMLTPGDTRQLGGLFYPQPMSSANLRITFSFEITGEGARADGIVLVAAQNLPNDERVDKSGAGGRLGNDLFTQAIAVEFDTYNNAWDTSDSHVGLSLMGDVTEHDHPLAIAATELDLDLRNSGVYDAEVTLDAGQLEVYLSNSEQGIQRKVALSLAIPDTVPLENYLEEYYIGLVAATGGNTDRHIIHEVHLEGAGTAAPTPTPETPTPAPETPTPTPETPTPAPPIGGREAHPDDVTALKALYDATDGSNWSNSDDNNWLTTARLDEWKGVKVNGVGRVIELKLQRNNLIGNIPPELGNSLSRLTLLNLSNNQLDGEIPASLANLERLRELRLQRNSLSGPIPSELGNSLSKLTLLNLSHNQLDEEIPASLADLPNLETLSLHGNQFTGCTPRALIGIVTTGRGVQPGTGSGGGLPAFCQLPVHPEEREALVSFYEATGGSKKWEENTKWTSDSPLDEWYGVKVDRITGRVTKLELNSNNLNNSGNSNTLGMLGKLTGLTYLDLSENALGGALPPELDLLTEITHLDLSHNSFRGDITWANKDRRIRWENLKSLVTLDLSNNRSGGPIGRNGLSGWVPGELGSLPNLTAVNLSHNQLTGFVPAWLFNLRNADLSNNKAWTCTPADLSLYGVKAALWGVVECTDKDLLNAFYQQADGKEKWTTKTNWASKNPISKWYGVVTNPDDSEKVIGLFLPDNQLAGHLDALIEILGGFEQLTYLDVSGNSLITNPYEEKVDEWFKKTRIGKADKWRKAGTNAYANFTGEPTVGSVAKLVEDLSEVASKFTESRNPRLEKLLRKISTASGKGIKAIGTVAQVAQYAQLFSTLHSLDLTDVKATFNAVYDFLGVEEGLRYYPLEDAMYFDCLLEHNYHIFPQQAEEQCGEAP